MRKPVLMVSFRFPRPFDNAGETLTQRLEKLSPDAQRMRPYYDRVDAIMGGLDEVRNNPEFLPKFPDEAKDAYSFRLSVSKLTNIYRDVVESLASKPFESEVTLPEGENKTVPQPVKEFIENVDGRGNNLTVFASETFFNGINATHDWILVDYPKVDPGTIRNMAEMKAAGIRPFWNHVLARNVHEVRNRVVGGNERLEYIRVFEPAANGTRDRFSEWELINGQVQLTRYEKNEKGEYEQIETGILTIDQIPMVPFITSRREGESWSFDPALRDAVDLQRTLFQQESALEFVKIMCAFPMLSGNGVKQPTGADGKPAPLAVGPGRVLYAPRDGQGNVGSWAYVEPSANTLKFLQEDVKETKKDLRELGKQPLTAQSGNLTVITTAVAAGKAKTAVGAWGLALKDALENALVITGKWLNIKLAEYDPEVTVYDGYDDFGDVAAEVGALSTARTARDLSQETYWEELQRRRILSDEFDPTKERERLLRELPGDTDTESPDDLTRNPPANPQNEETPDDPQ